MLILYLPPAKRSRAHIHRESFPSFYLSLSRSLCLSLSLSRSLSYSFSPLQSTALLYSKCSRSGATTLYTSSFISRKRTAAARFLFSSRCFALLAFLFADTQTVIWFLFVSRCYKTSAFLDFCMLHLFCRLDIIPCYFRCLISIFTYLVVYLVIFSIIIQTLIRMKFKLEDSPTCPTYLPIYTYTVCM